MPKMTMATTTALRTVAAAAAAAITASPTNNNYAPTLPPPPATTTTPTDCEVTIADCTLADVCNYEEVSGASTRFVCSALGVAISAGVAAMVA